MQQPIVAHALLSGGPLAITPFAALWLRSHGAPLAMLGVMLALPLLARLALARHLAAWAARFRSGWPPMAALSALATLAVAIGSMSHHLIVALAGWAIASVSASACLPILDAVILVPRNFGRSSAILGRAKAVGSLAYLLATLTIGLCAARFGPVAIMPWAAATGCLVTLYLAFSARQTACAPTLPPANHPDPPPPTSAAPLSLAMLAIVLVEASHGLHAIAMVAWQARGLGAQVNGALWATGTLCDVLFLTLAGPFCSRVGPARLLVLGAAAAIVRWLGFALSPSLPTLFMLQALHALSFTATALAGVQITRSLNPDRAGRSSQIITWATSTGLAGGFATIFAGPLYATFGAQGYWLMVALAAAGLVTAILFEQTMAQKYPASLRTRPVFFGLRNSINSR